MEKRRYFGYNKTALLTIPRLQELSLLLQKHGKCIKYSVITKNQAEVSFDSFEELSGFDNFQENKIASLKIKCSNCIQSDDEDVYIEIVFSPSFPHEADSVRCYYSFSDTEKETIFISDFTKFLKKTATYDRSYKICEWASFLTFFILGLYPALLPLGGVFYYQRAKGAFPVIMTIIISELLALCCYYLCSRLIWRKLFPKVIYAWGEEAAHYQKLEKLRSQLFWGVLVAPVMSIIVGLLLK